MNKILVPFDVFKNLVEAVAQCTKEAVVVDTFEDVVISYPEKPYRGIYVYFKKRLDFDERSRAYNILEYWRSLPFVGSHQSYCIFSSPDILYAEVNENSGAGSDPRKHAPFELLAKYLVEGTAPRKDNTIKYAGLGDIVSKIEGI